MSEQTTNTKKQKLIYFVPLLLILTAIAYMAGLAMNYRSQIQADLTYLRDNQSKLELLNSKYSADNKKLYIDLRTESESTILPWQLRDISNKISAQSIQSKLKYSDELIIVRNEFVSSLDAWKEGLNNNLVFDGKNQALEDVASLRAKVDSVTSARELDDQKIAFVKLQDKYNKQLELYNKKALVGGLKSAQGDIDGLIEYFKKYPDLISSQQKVEKYKTELEFFNTQENLDKYTFIDLEERLNSQIRPLLTEALNAKNSNEEKIRAQSQANSNSQAPIKSGKVIVINKTNQYMKVYNDGVLIKESKVTTGRTNWPTDTGTYSILTKERDRRLQGSGQGATWNVFVKYWMLFNGPEEEGIHDASWRNGNFGGPDFVTNGSRGCVNTPEEMMIWLFDWASIGTPVVIQD
jgi:lipoprotein-anchoring transpeptidase ErfK/SrfK